MSRVLLTGSLISVLCGLGCGVLPVQAAESKSGTGSQSGSETYTSYYSEVDACNRAQMLRPAESTVTDMDYWRVGGPGERGTTCRIKWSNADDALPTGRPILFGRNTPGSGSASGCPLQRAPLGGGQRVQMVDGCESDSSTPPSQRWRFWGGDTQVYPK